MLLTEKKALRKVITDRNYTRQNPLNTRKNCIIIGILALKHPETGTNSKARTAFGTKNYPKRQKGEKSGKRGCQEERDVVIYSSAQRAAKE